ncbi:substrate-binding domain-containing protein [Pseudomonas sp. CCI3.2]|uniref:substrate-binding domain-containing protein n=1 Tax=unclassified Pseudomonas TaxID=196821 RepID=UPI002AC8E821|nr:MULTISPECIES: substrate-binding domain-containing protein [unclassified Pseudomonas]MEB0077256.1 substrate-binding domain-containing protein [Pseudomonas sp. MH10out]MEB0091413.1 substrate-binding domain-containing protein [Pseudomonas sp. CCI4.2]MEB0101603.1 substrate-binding domain-containing protein [Pseudomonas sp. CCI3.2]MEB0129281.1 substrate-binding domain-containing protein [Pseudomonas sp. CCI2.4]MEB0157468.1 substrate-binding domain-containing protein [Pseudomonas sp. AH2 (2023)]
MRLTLLFMLITSAAFSNAQAGDLNVLTAGAFKPILVAMAPRLKTSAHINLIISNATAGELSKRIDAGESFDVAILTDTLASTLERSGKLAQGSVRNVAKVGIGVAVPLGAPKPDISTVDRFKNTLLSQQRVAYISPSSGGSSGVYLSALFSRLGIADDIANKAVLVNGGLVGTTLVDGKATLAIHQISELFAVKNIQYVGPLPKAIQSYTRYAAGIANDSSHAADAAILMKALADKQTLRLLQKKGMGSPDPL